VVEEITLCDLLCSRCAVQKGWSFYMLGTCVLDDCAALTTLSTEKETDILNELANQFS